MLPFVCPTPSGFDGEVPHSLEPQLHDLEAALRSETRLEAEEAEREAARSAAMRRTMRDVACGLMAHGDTVAVGVGGGHVLRGVLWHVGTDYLSLGNRVARIDIRLDAVAHVAVAEHALAGGRGSSRNEAPAWRARLLELELLGSEVSVGLRGTDEELSGPVAIVGADHLSLGDPGHGPARFIPFPAVAYLRSDLSDGWEGGDD